MSLIFQGLRNKAASWRKFHAAVNQSHYIEACILTDRFEADDQQVPFLLEQIDEAIDHFTGDGAFDKTPVYEAILHHSADADVVIPPAAKALFLSSIIDQFRSFSLQ